MGKKIGKICAVVAAILIVLAGVLYGSYKLWIDPYRGTVEEFAPSEYGMDDTLSGEEAREDLAYLMKCLKRRHPAWLDGSGKDKLVQAQYEKEKSSIGESVSLLELYRAASRIVATLHDGHTRVYLQNDDERYVDDFELIHSYGNPVTINGISSQELLNTYKEMCSYETDYYAEACFWGNGIVTESILQMCGVDTSDGVTMTFQVNGKEITHKFQFVSLDLVKGYQAGEEDGKWVYYDIDKENDLGIFTLKSCVCDEEYERVLGEFFQKVLRKDIGNVVVDLRGNGGGNSWVANEFLQYIDVEEYKSWDCGVRLGPYLKENKDIVYQNQKKAAVFKGNLYVLTDTWTYSAAMDFAMLIQDNGLGTIVGSPSGNLPDSYGDCLFFQLPNSGMPLTVSYKRWYRIDKSKAGEPIMPDIIVEPEKALEKVYELIRS